MHMYQRILVGVDGSKESLYALAEAVKLGKLLSSKVEVMLVIPPRIYTQLAEREIVDQTSSGETRHVSLLQKEENEIAENIHATATAEGSEVTLHTRVGDPVDALIEYGQSDRCDLIVVGSTGKGMAGRLILGSVSGGVVHRSPVPVLVVRQPGSG